MTEHFEKLVGRYLELVLEGNQPVTMLLNEVGEEFLIGEVYVFIQKVSGDPRKPNQVEKGAIPCAGGVLRSSVSHYRMLCQQEIDDLKGRLKAYKLQIDQKKQQEKALESARERCKLSIEKGDNSNE